jgi:hypothetical protein
MVRVWVCRRWIHEDVVKFAIRNPWCPTKHLQTFIDRELDFNVGDIVPFNVNKAKPVLDVYDSWAESCILWVEGIIDPFTRTHD